MDYNGESLVEPADVLLYASDAKKLARGRKPDWCPLKPTNRFINTLDAAIIDDSFQTHVRLNMAHDSQVTQEANMVVAAKKMGEGVRSRAAVKQMIKAVVKQEDEWAHNPKNPPEIPPWRGTEPILQPKREPSAPSMEHSTSKHTEPEEWLLGRQRGQRLFEGDGPGLMGSKRKTLNVKERLEHAAQVARAGGAVFGSHYGSVINSGAPPPQPTPQVARAGGAVFGSHYGSVINSGAASAALRKDSAGSSRVSGSGSARDSSTGSSPCTAQGHTVDAGAGTACDGGGEHDPFVRATAAPAPAGGLEDLLRMCEAATARVVERPAVNFGATSVAACGEGGSGTGEGGSAASVKEVAVTELPPKPKPNMLPWRLDKERALQDIPPPPPQPRRRPGTPPPVDSDDDSLCPPPSSPPCRRPGTPPPVDSGDDKEPRPRALLLPSRHLGAPPSTHGNSGRRGGVEQSAAAVAPSAVVLSSASPLHGIQPVTGRGAAVGAPRIDSAQAVATMQPVANTQAKAQHADKAQPRVEASSAAGTHPAAEQHPVTAVRHAQRQCSQLGLSEGVAAPAADTDTAGLSSMGSALLPPPVGSTVAPGSAQPPSLSVALGEVASRDAPPGSLGMAPRDGSGKAAPSSGVASAGAVSEAAPCVPPRCVAPGTGASTAAHTLQRQAQEGGLRAYGPCSDAPVQSKSSAEALTQPSVGASSVEPLSVLGGPGLQPSLCDTTARVRGQAIAPSGGIGSQQATEAPNGTVAGTATGRLAEKPTGPLAMGLTSVVASEPTSAVPLVAKGASGAPTEPASPPGTDLSEVRLREDTSDVPVSEELSDVPSAEPAWARNGGSVGAMGPAGPLVMDLSGVLTTEPPPLPSSTKLATSSASGAVHEPSDTSGAVPEPSDTSGATAVSDTLGAIRGLTPVTQLSEMPSSLAEGGAGGALPPGESSGLSPHAHAGELSTRKKMPPGLPHGHGSSSPMPGPPALMRRHTTDYGVIPTGVTAQSSLTLSAAHSGGGYGGSGVGGGGMGSGRGTSANSAALAPLPQPLPEPGALRSTQHAGMLRHAHSASLPLHAVPSEGGGGGSQTHGSPARNHVVMRRASTAGDPLAGMSSAGRASTLLLWKAHPQAPSAFGAAALPQQQAQRWLSATGPSSSELPRFARATGQQRQHSVVARPQHAAGATQAAAQVAALLPAFGGRSVASRPAPTAPHRKTQLAVAAAPMLLVGGIRQAAQATAAASH